VRSLLSNLVLSCFSKTTVPGSNSLGQSHSPLPPLLLKKHVNHGAKVWQNTLPSLHNQCNGPTNKVQSYLITPMDSTAKSYLNCRPSHAASWKGPTSWIPVPWQGRVALHPLPVLGPTLVPACSLQCVCITTIVYTTSQLCLHNLKELKHALKILQGFQPSDCIYYFVCFVLFVTSLCCKFSCFVLPSLYPLYIWLLYYIICLFAFCLATRKFGSNIYH
jgi:hypothetical protein